VIAGLNRDQIVSRFEEWLDDVLASEKPPEGIGEEILLALREETETCGRPHDETSSYALWSAMTALSQEVKLQGRAFKELTAAFDSQSASTGDEIRATYRERERDAQRETERRCRKEILGSLIDLRDRLARGLTSAQASAADMSRASQRGWFSRMFGKTRPVQPETVIAALIRGYELGLERLDQTLEEFNARPISSLGELFDPRSMNAVEKQNSNEVPEGTVLEVYLTGFEWNGEVFRPALVKVSAGAKGTHGNE
jgi:molecular chaperone GrpE